MYGKLNVKEIKCNNGSVCTYSDKFILRLTSPVTELARSIWPPETNLIAGRDSAEITRSKIKATACLNVAAAVLKRVMSFA